MTFKTGLRYRHQRRDLDQEAEQYSSYRGPDGVAGRNSATGINDDNLARFIDSSYRYTPIGGRYPASSYIRPAKSA